MLAPQSIYDKIQVTCEELDELTNKWTKDFTDASQQSTPRTKYKILPYYRTTHETRLLQIQYRALTEEIRRHGTSYDTHARLNQLRQEMQNLHKQLYIQDWDNKISRMDIETDPKRFWTNIKKLQGNDNKTSATYIRDHNGQRICDDSDKEAIFRNYWRKVFDISDLENMDFDRQNDEFIRQETIEHSHETNPYQLSDLTRLNEHSPAVTIQEIRYIVKTMEQNLQEDQK